MSLLLVDGHYYAYRSFYAIRSLVNSRGEPTNAVYGFAQALKRMLAEVQPTAGAVIFDGGLPTERLALQPDYKANRPEMPEALARQMMALQELGPILGLRTVCVEGQEADDLIASYAEASTGSVVLATKDKDLLQLVTERVRVYDPQGTDFSLLGPAEVVKKWGVPAHQIGEVLSLMGDASDNIPGVPGFGVKTATALIQKFGTVETLLARLEEVTPARIQQALRVHREQVLSNRAMVKLQTRLPLPLPLDALTLRPDRAKQVEFFHRHEFRGLTAEARTQLASEQQPQQGELF